LGDIDSKGGEDTCQTRRLVRFACSGLYRLKQCVISKIRAILDHRYHVSREDLREVAHPALRHRLILNFEGQAENIQADDVIDNVLESIEAPAMAV